VLMTMLAVGVLLNISQSGKGEGREAAPVRAVKRKRR